MGMSCENYAIVRKLIKYAILALVRSITFVKYMLSAGYSFNPTYICALFSIWEDYFDDA